ncbi:MAG: SMC-Scp complex subunit ScpB [Myxococcota bacterium]|nr:SMC-Scp complex subunit ScpB [Myxococcota bacterium]
MSRPRKPKPRSGEHDGLTDVGSDESARIESAASDDLTGASTSGDEPILGDDDREVLRAVEEVADAIVARVLAEDPDDTADDDDAAPAADEDAELDLALSATSELAADDDDGALPGEDTEERPGLEKAPPLSVGSDHLKGVIESLLFVSDRPLPANRLSKIARAPAKEVQRLLDVLIEDYRGRGIELIEVAGGFQFRSSAGNAPFVRELVARKPVRLTRAQVEALAMIAYRQPITRPEVDEIRGVDSGSAMKVLLEKNLVKIIGRKDEAGRPLLYGTTPYFLEFFGLASLSDLPTLKEYSELSDESRALFQRRTGEAIDDIADIQVEKHEYDDDELEAAAASVAPLEESVSAASDAADEELEGEPARADTESSGDEDEDEDDESDDDEDESDDDDDDDDDEDDEDDEDDD